MRFRFIDSSPEPFHCVETIRSILAGKGFSALDEDDLWKANNHLKRGGKYYYTRNKSSIVAFTPCEYGGAMRARSGGMRMRHWKDMPMGCGATLTSPWAIHICLHQEAMTAPCQYGGQIKTTRAPSCSHEDAVRVHIRRGRR